jgi:hypothetical protein
MKYSVIYNIIILAILALMLFFNLNFSTWTDGDEPHYIVGAESLVQDHDFDLTNQQQTKSFVKYRPDVNFNVHAINDINNRLRPTHGIALSILYSPTYLIGNSILNSSAAIIKGARLTQFIIFIIGFLFLIVYLKKINPEIDNFVFIPWLISPVIFLYSTVIFPDMIQGVCFLITALGIYELYQNINNQLKLNSLIVFLGGLSAGINLFVHYKTFLTTALMIIMYFVYALLSNKKLIFSKKIFLFLVPFGISVILHMFLTYRWYNSFSFGAIQGFTASQGYNKTIFDLFPNNPLIGFAGQIWDIDKGVFWMGMTVLLYLFGFKDWFIKNRFSFVVFGIPSLISIIFYSTYIEWAAGFCPAGRYLIPFMFLLFPSYYFSYINIKNSIFGKLYIGISIIFSLLVLISFKKGFHRNGFPSLQVLNLHYVTISRMLKIPDLNLYLRFLDFENKSLNSIYGLLGIIFFSVIFLKFYPIIKILIREFKSNYYKS